MKRILILILSLSSFYGNAMHVSRPAYASQRQKNSFSFSPMRKSTVRSILKKSSVNELGKSALPRNSLYQSSARVGVGCEFKKDASKSLNNPPSIREKLADGIETVGCGLGAVMIGIPVVVGGVYLGATLAGLTLESLVNSDIKTPIVIVGTGATLLAIGTGASYYLRKE